MKAQYYTLAAYLLLFCGGCSTTQYSLSPNHVAANTLAADPENLQVAASLKKSIVVIEPKEITIGGSDFVGFNVAVTSGHPEAFTFGVENINVQHAGREIVVLPEDDLIAHEEGKEAASTFMNLAAIVGAAYLDYEAGRATGVLDTTLTSTTTQMAVSNMDKASEISETSIWEYRETVLKSSDVEPGGKHGGYFYVRDLNPSSEQDSFTVSIKVADEEHVFSFDLSQTK